MKKLKSKIENRDKIIAGLELAYQNLLESKRKNNSEIVIIKDNKIVRIKP
jgi:hypothetical protein